MTIGYYLLIGICSFQVTTIIIYITYYRKWITAMNGMMISMAVGMAVGILGGTILGVVLHGNLFESTVYAILLGLTVGFIAGIPMGLPAVIDGMLSGTMGGMMGAMLGDMIAITRPNDIIFIMSLLVTMILLLVLYTTEELIRKHAGQTVFSFFKYPFSCLFIIGVIFLGLSLL